MTRVLRLFLLFILTSCFGGEEGASSGGGLFIGHKESTNAISFILPSNGTYNESDTLVFVISHPDNMTITAGPPRIVLDIGGVSRDATYVSGDGTKNLVFQYTVVAGDEDADGIEITSVETDGGSIDFSQGAVNLALPSLNTSNILVSTTPQVAITNPITSDLVNIANDTATYSVMGTCNQTGVTVSMLINSGAVSSPVDFVCDGATFSGTFDISTEADGALTLEADLMGVTSNSVAITKDTIAPNLAITSNPNIISANVSNYTISGTCDETSASVNVDIGGLTNSATCDGTNWSVSGWDLSALSDAPTIAVNVGYADAAGNPASDSSAVSKATSYTISLNALSAINLANATSYTIDGTCSNDGEAISLDIASATITDSQNCSGGAFSFSLDVSSVADNASVAIQVDHGSASDTTNVLKDTVAPSIAITSALDIDASNVATYSLSGTCDEASASVSINLGGLSNSATCDGTNWSISGWDVSSEADAIGISLTADITDAAGNPATQATDTVDKDTAVYTVSIVSAVAINSNNVSSYTVSGTCSNDGEAVALDIGGAIVTDSQNCSGGSFNFTLDVSAVADNAAIAIQVDHGSASDSVNALKDTAVPTLDSNTISANTYSLGETISISINFSEAVVVLGAPRVELTFESQSSSPLYATLASGNGTSTLVFEYTIASGDNDANGILIASSIDLNSGSIRDAAANDAQTNLVTTSFPSVLVDSAAPYITSFVEPANGTYADGGGELLFQVNFSENVNVTGSPEISINIGGSTVAATYKSGSGTSGLEFSYLIQAGDNDADGITLNSSSIQNGGIVATSDSDPAALEFGTYLDSMSGVLIDTSGAITAPNQVTGVSTAPTTSNTELSVAWAVPSDNGTAIINYSVQYREQGTSTWLNVSPNPTSNSTTVNGLSSGVTYEIRVAANNGLLGPYSATSTAEIFDVLALNPVAWLSSTNITNGGSEPSNNDKIDQWEDLTGAASAATEADPAKQPVYETNVQNGLPAVRFDNLDRGLAGTFSRSIGTDLTFVIVGQFDVGSTDTCLFEFSGGGSARGFFIDRRYAGNSNYVTPLTKGSLNLWTIQDDGNNAIVTENSVTTNFNGSTNFNTDFTGTGNYVLGDDITGNNRMNGYIAEFLIFDRALTPSEISTLENYLKNKWGL